MKRLRGFTLIELVIVVAIIALLAAIAIPTYRRYAYRSHRTDGQEMLMRIAQAEERYYTAYNRYPIELSSLGYTGTVTSEHGYYQAALGLPGGASAGTAYIATAQPIDGQVGDACGSLTIDNKGSKQPDSTKTQYNTNGPCWGN